MKEDFKRFSEIVRETRISFLSAKPKTTCETEEKTMLSDQHIEDNVNGLMKRLNLENIIRSTPYANVSYETLQKSAEMFTYLNYCPPKFYNSIIQIIKSASSKHIILTMTSILKMSKNAAKRSSIKMLMKVIAMFKLDFYKKIDKITIGNGFNECKLNGQNDSCNESLKVLGKIYYIFPQ